ncbi:hypothetical protein CY34DRAFT_802594 [Suillus luteus UH-Slu-Lm8-n1]|uniref:DUF7330 domain-containing protein n=1 Tax=Suillus luteus UH-Slu-Lm8-n1 TaxID=930992 RepID=A0A0D0AS69_9AGAM|nr:hypothetical protein CY34DRAFT_802594 [Suillus luteus UH-Slu-Lm8-n1]
MIIVETTPNRTDDKGNRHDGQRAGLHEGSSTNTSGSLPPPPYTSQTSYQPITDVVVVVYRQSPAQRFWKAFGVAVLIWFLVAAFTTSSTDMAFNHVSRLFLDNHCVQSSNGEPSHPGPKDGTVHQCISGSDWESSGQSFNHFPHSAEVFLELPVDSDILYLFTKGSQAGHVEIEQSDQPTDKVSVHVRVGYHTREALRGVNVYRLERKTRENGVGIYAPTLSYLFGHGQQLKFEVKIMLPAGKDGDALHIKAFETNTSNYSQDVAHIWETTSFDRISLRTSNGHINAKSVTAENGLICSSNGGINGHFNIASSLELVTSNAPITASVALLNRENETASKLKMLTSNGKINANVDLVTHSGHGGSFKVETHTSNAPVTFEYTDMPVNSSLNSRIGSSNAAVNVKLYSTFEGSFNMATSNGKAILEKLTVEDPSGQGRHRQVTVTQRPREQNRLEGSAYWSESKEANGHSTVNTSNGHVKLVI